MTEPLEKIASTILVGSKIEHEAYASLLEAVLLDISTMPSACVKVVTVRRMCNEKHFTGIREIFKITGESKDSQAAPAGATDPPDEPKHRDCHTEKVEYDKCFRNWYRYSYLRKDYDDPCANLFQTYNACLTSSLKLKGMGELSDPGNSIWEYD